MEFEWWFSPIAQAKQWDALRAETELKISQQNYHKEGRVFYWCGYKKEVGDRTMIPG